MIADWTPTPMDVARQLFQVRMALELPYLPTDQRSNLEQLAATLEHKYTTPRAQRALKGD